VIQTEKKTEAKPRRTLPSIEANYPFGSLSKPSYHPSTAMAKICDIIRAGLVAFVLFHGIAASCAQVNLPNAIPSVTVSPAILPQTATSDPAAVSALEKVIEASGGRQAWGAIHSAKVRLTVTSAGDKESHDVVMLDDWSSDIVRYRRGTVGASRKPKDHDGQTTLSVLRAGKIGQLHEFDQAHVLAGNLPAAAASIILRRPSYIAKEANGAKCAPPAFCVDIYFRSTDQGPFVRQEEWTLSDTSNLPLRIDLFLPNLMGSTPIIEEFQFDSMMRQAGLVIPNRIEMRPPGGGTQIRDVLRFEPNVAFDKDSFDQELSR